MSTEIYEYHSDSDTTPGGIVVAAYSDGDTEIRAPYVKLSPDERRKLARALDPDTYLEHEVWGATLLERVADLDEARREIARLRAAAAEVGPDEGPVAHRDLKPANPTEAAPKGGRPSAAAARLLADEQRAAADALAANEPTKYGIPKGGTPEPARADVTVDVQRIGSGQWWRILVPLGGQETAVTVEHARALSWALDLAVDMADHGVTGPASYPIEATPEPPAAPLEPTSFEAKTQTLLDTHRAEHEGPIEDCGPCWLAATRDDAPAATAPQGAEPSTTDELAARMRAEFGIVSTRDSAGSTLNAISGLLVRCWNETGEHPPGALDRAIARMRERVRQQAPGAPQGAGPDVAALTARAKRAEEGEAWAREKLQGWQDWAEEQSRNLPGEWQGGSWSDNARWKIAQALASAATSAPQGGPADEERRALVAQEQATRWLANIGNKAAQAAVAQLDADRSAKEKGWPDHE